MIKLFNIFFLHYWTLKSTQYCLKEKKTLNELSPGSIGSWTFHTHVFYKLFDLTVSNGSLFC